jgi:L-lactate dehydrogenase complex protein LldG
MSTPRERILSRIAEAVGQRTSGDHPGGFPGQPPWRGRDPSPVAQFRERFEAAGGEAVLLPSADDARSWLRAFAQDFESVAFGATVPGSLRFDTAECDPSSAALAISMARFAVSETGTLVLDARDGRRTQLLSPTHVVLVWTGNVYATLLEFLQRAGEGPLPSALGLHSGPSSSADIGLVVVRGIHGPGRIIAAILAWDRSS